MLSLFPTLFAYNMAVPLVFRIVIGLAFIMFGYSNSLKNQEKNAGFLEQFKMRPGKIWLRILIVLEGVGGALLVIGLYTQLVALVFSVLLLLALLAKQKKSDSISFSQKEIALMLLVTLSLLFLGPGFYAFDLPL